MPHLKFSNGRTDKGSTVLSASFDPNRDELTIHFRSGRSYTYSDFPSSKVLEFEQSLSRGKYVHSQIIPHHPATEITV